MEKKPSARGSSAERRDHGARTTEGTPTKDLERAYAGLFEGWTDFYRDMGDRLSASLSKQQKTYGELLATWTEFADAAGKLLSEASGDGSAWEMYDVWRNYANKIGTRITQATADGLKGYGEVASSLRTYGGKLTDAASRAAGGRFDMAKAEEVYDAWFEVVGKVRAQLEHATGLSRDEFQDLSRTWLEFSRRMESLAANGGEGPYARLTDLWMRHSKAVGEAFAAAIRGQDKDNQETRKAWAEHLLRIQSTMADLASEIGTGYEDLYRRFLRGGLTTLSDLPMVPWWSVPRSRS